MTTVKELSEAYVPKETKNIADLQQFDINLKIETKVVNEGKPEEFSYDYIELDGIEYRVPKSVLKQIKMLLEDEPNLINVKVKRQGEGLNTNYMVVKA